MKRCAAFLAAAAVGWVLVAGAETVSVERIGTVAAPGLPGAVAVWGERAEVVLTAPTGGRGPRLAVVAAAEGEAGRVVLLAATFMPGESVFARLLEERLADLPGMPVPTPQAPLDETRPLERMAHVLELRRLERQGVGEVRAHPSAAAFPGAVDGAAERISRTVRVDLSRPRWHTTGLYAAPGERVRVSVAGEVPAGLRVRIGAHTDNIEHLPSWQRPPRISRSFEVARTGETEVASPFGGAVYVEVPEGGRGAGGKVEVTISGAVAAPVFVLGETTAAQWREVRSAPGPWAELVVPGRLVLTTRSDAVREVEDLTPVLEHWRAVMDAMADLAGIDQERAYPERIVPDVQISAGYMHAGYPIMTHLDVTRSMVDLEQLRSLKGGWGFYHELGHNHQKPEWTFEGTGEVTCNLFVHYVFEKVVGMSAEEASERALGPAMRRLIEAHLAEPDFRRWQREPFLALAMYAQLHTTFGWEPFRRVFAEYRDLPAAGRPQSQSDRRDQWMVRMSRAAGRNLGPFFDGWGVPVTEAAKAEVSELPVWVPW